VAGGIVLLFRSQQEKRGLPAALKSACQQELLYATTGCWNDRTILQTKTLKRLEEKGFGRR
jgi:hypothetical protein